MYFIFNLSVVLCVSLATAAEQSRMRVIDMTHEHSMKSIAWPGNPAYNFTELYRGPSGSYWYEANYVGTPEHSGTHLDAPAHFAEGGWRTQQIPAEKLVGPAVVINVKAKAAQNPDYRVTVDDILAWEAKHNTQVPAGAILFMNSGWSGKYPNKTRTFGSNQPTEPSTFHFPGYHEDTADWLVKNRNIHVVAVDTPSIDYGQSTTFDVHVILAKANIPGLENVANMDMIPEIGAQAFVGAMKVFDGSGGPARVFATFYESTGDDTNAAPNSVQGSLSVLVLTVSFFMRFV